MRVVLMTNDLMTSSQVESAAKYANVELCVADSPLRLEQIVAQFSVNRVILDLACPVVEPARIVSVLQQFSPTPQILAFGPHVHTETLSAAKAAGCEVVSRGQFFAQLADYLCGQSEQ